jgi:predicted aldo/keto reductase-like oxidoreductase
MDDGIRIATHRTISANLASTVTPCKPSPRSTIVVASGKVIRIIRSAIDRGITFMDNCWDYHNGESERRMGLALGHGVSRTLHTGRMSPKENDCHEG